MKRFPKALLPVFSAKMAPGGGGGVLTDFTRRGTNYLHTTLLKLYPKSNFLHFGSIFFGSGAPK